MYIDALDLVAIFFVCLFSMLSLSSSDLTGVKGEMMEMEPSQPIVETYVGGDSFHDDDEAASESDVELVEEDMASNGQCWA